jgi:Papain family cysteine protease
MTDEPHGLGCIPSPPDERDYPISALYEALSVEAPVALPAAYAATPVPPITNQGDTPQCVAYSTAGMKSFQDYDDQTPVRWWSFDEGRLFAAIGGGPYGAYLRDAMGYLLNTGYPVVGNTSPASAHKVAAYYSVPVSVADIKAAIATFGEVVFGATWANSWFTPHSDGTLPAFDSTAGGHAIRCRGWDDAKGFRLANSWGTAWGVNGECYLPYDQLNAVFEVWKAPDQPQPTPPPPPPPPPPSPTIFHWHVAHDAKIKVYGLRPVVGCILPGWTTTVWTGAAFSAPCSKPAARKTCDGTSSATTVKPLSGKFYGKTVGVSPRDGTSVT